ncbi:MAG: hypothetical protein QM784_10480 [Polyangiaceae bacterium]
MKAFSICLSLCLVVSANGCKRDGHRHVAQTAELAKSAEERLVASGEDTQQPPLASNERASVDVPEIPGVPRGIQDFYVRFREAVKQDQRTAVAQMIHYPIVVSLDGKVNNEVSIRDSTEFLKLYDRVMTKPLVGVIIRNGADHLHGSKDGPVRLYRGQLYIYYACPRDGELCTDGPIRVLRISNLEWLTE